MYNILCVVIFVQTLCGFEVIMFPFIPLRRIKILLTSSGAKRRDYTAHSLQDCLDKPVNKAHGVWKLFFVAWILGAILCYLYWDQATKMPAQPYMEVFPEDGVEAVTEKVTMKDVFNYTKDPHKIKIALAKAENTIAATSMKDVLAFSRILEQRRNLPLCVLPTESKNVSIHIKKVKNLENKLALISMGGYYTPRDCRARHKIGILVPYRDREENLAVFLYNIHPFLIRQNLEYRIFLIEQYGKDLFNRGRLFNAGYRELEKMGEWPCIIFHDVDLLPTDNRILYTCPTTPRHMCATVLEKEQLPNYRTLFGGVAAMTASQYKKVNGYSNMYWGWGGEDNDMFWRLKVTGLGMTRYSKKIAQFTALPHQASTPVNQYRYHMLKTGMDRYKDDGLSSVQYMVVSYQIRHLYTHILVDINPWKENITKLVMSIKQNN